MSKLLDEKTSKQVKEILDKMNKNATINLFKSGNNETDQMIEQLYSELSELSEKLNLKIFDHGNTIIKEFNVDESLLPATVLSDETVNFNGIKFYGIPSGHEFGTLIQDIVSLSNNIIEISNDAQKEIEKIKDEVRVRVFITATCPHCPRAVYMAHQSSMVNSNISGEMIDANSFRDISVKHGVSSVPHTIIEKRTDEGWKVTAEFVGAQPENTFIEELKKV